MTQKNGKSTYMRSEAKQKRQYTERTKMMLVLPVLQLLVAKRVVDIHDISSKEHDDPQSNEHRAFLLKYYS